MEFKTQAQQSQAEAAINAMKLLSISEDYIYDRMMEAGINYNVHDPYLSTSFVAELYILLDEVISKKQKESKASWQIDKAIEIFNNYRRECD